MPLSSRHRIRNSSIGGLRLSTLPLGHGGFPQYWVLHVDGEEFFFVSFKPPRPGTEPRALAWKAAVLTTTLGPPPFSAGIDFRRQILTSEVEPCTERITLISCWTTVFDAVPTLGASSLFFSYHGYRHLVKRHSLTWTAQSFTDWETSIKRTVYLINLIHYCQQPVWFFYLISDNVW